LIYATVTETAHLFWRLLRTKKATSLESDSLMRKLHVIC
jgi:hypothetical protein